MPSQLESRQKYKEEIASLPKENGWIPGQSLYLYKGFWLLQYFVEGTMYAQDNFQADPANIFICSFMKSGCTWLKALSFTIATRAHHDEFESTTPLRTTLPHKCIRSLEYGDPNYTPPGPPTQLVASHLPYQLLPQSIIDSGCKIVYLCRDPKDTFVSMWHFFRKGVDESKKEAWEGSQLVPDIEEAFDMFCKGVSSQGPYWDHVLGYWKAASLGSSGPKKNKILWLKYEEMMEDTGACVRKLADFFGCPFSEDEERDGMVERIVKFCSFESLSNLEVNKYGKEVKGSMSMGYNAFFRKGKVGDWKNHLTAEMGKRLDKIIEDKLSGSGFTFRSSSAINH